ncbi:MAG: DUF5615 family PIN-like protein [Cytophagaceae bacterium]|nr:DUF5615 family PIN-like protein [Cytophagaceae bacterium]
MLRFLIDTQLPPLLAEILGQRGYDAIHSTYFENEHLLKDKALIEIATVQEQIIITKDSDFLRLFFFERRTAKSAVARNGKYKEPPSV